MVKKIYAVWVYAKDLDESRKFYENVLGLKFKFQQEGWIEFDLGETSFAILQRLAEQGPLKPQKTRVMFQVDDMQAMKNILIDNHVKVMGDIRNEVYGKLLTFEDPNGHWLELYEPIKPVADIA